MTRLGWVVPVVALGLVACEAPPTGACGGQDCADGQRCDADSLTCVEDTAPTLTLSAPTAVVTSDRFTVTGTARDDVAVKSVSWSLLDGGTSLAVTPDADGAFAITVPAPLTDEQGLTLVVRASDGTRETRAQATVRVDRVGPTFEWVSPAAGSTVGGETTTVEVRATDASGGLSALRIGDVAITAPASGVAASASVPVPAGLDKALFDVEVSATDAHGNATTRHFSVLGDRVAPSLAFTSPAQDDAWVTTATLEVALLAQDPSGPVVVRVEAFDAGVVEALAGVAGAYTAALAVPPGEATAVLRVEAVDALGNTATAERRVRIDTVPPTLSLTAPAEASVHRQALQIAATTGGGVALVEARLGSAAPVAMTGSGATWSVTLPVPAQDYGALTLDVTAADEAGNTATASRTVFVDTVAPTIAFLAPASGRRFNIADFSSSNDVAVSWQVTDGDAQAAVTQVNGAPSTATSLLAPTSTTDNGRVVTTTVTAADRAGNTATASHTFSVDRVRPTVTSWTPAVDARNVEPRVTSVTFSEPVSGPTSATDALTLAPSPPTPGAWNTAHTQWTSATLASYTQHQSTLASLADDHGNEVLPEGRRFHTAARSTPGNTLLATNVLHFRATGDNDGLVTVALQQFGATSTFRIRGLSPHTLTFDTLPYVETTQPLDYSLNAWNHLNPSVSLSPLVQVAWVFTHAAAGGGIDLHTRGRYFSSVGASSMAPAQQYYTAHTGPVMTNEPTTGGVSATDNAEFYRATLSVMLPFAPSVHIAQSTDSWVGYRVLADRVRWTRMRCNRDRLSIPNTVVCGTTEFAAPISLPSELSVAMNPGGQCLVTLFEAGNAPFGVFQPLPNCDLTLASPGGCVGNTALVPASRPNKTRVAPFFANGENTILAAWKSAGALYLGKMSNPAACTDAWTPIGQPVPIEGFGKFEPVQVGTRAGLLYVDASDNLRLYVP